MPPLSSYLLKWALCDPQLLSETATSSVYKVRFEGQDAVLKMLNQAGIIDEAGGVVALQYFDGEGAVRLLNYDEGAQLLEYAGGEDLLPLVASGEDDRATEIIADVLHRLHGARTDSPSAALVTIDSRFAALFRRAAKSEDDLFSRAAVVAEQLLSSQTCQCVLHGDIHHENVRHADGRGWLAIDPKGLYGDRTFDAANVFLNPQQPGIVLNEGRFSRVAHILAAHMTLDVARLLGFAFSFACLSAAWSLEDGQDASLALATAKIADRRFARR